MGHKAKTVTLVSAEGFEYVVRFSTHSSRSFQKEQITFRRRVPSRPPHPQRPNIPTRWPRNDDASHTPLPPPPASGAPHPTTAAAVFGSHSAAHRHAVL